MVLLFMLNTNARQCNQHKRSKVHCILHTRSFLQDENKIFSWHFIYYNIIIITEDLEKENTMSTFLQKTKLQSAAKNIEIRLSNFPDQNYAEIYFMSNGIVNYNKYFTYITVVNVFNSL
jgi:hypothetical protein